MDSPGQRRPVLKLYIRTKYIVKDRMYYIEQNIVVDVY